MNLDARMLLDDDEIDKIIEKLLEWGLVRVGPCQHAKDDPTHECKGSVGLTKMGAQYGLVLSSIAKKTASVPEGGIVALPDEVDPNNPEEIKRFIAGKLGISADDIEVEAVQKVRKGKPSKTIVH